MKKKSWHQNRPTGQRRNIIIKCWGNNMPIRGLNYEKALNTVFHSSVWQLYYDTYLA